MKFPSLVQNALAAAAVVAAAAAPLDLDSRDSATWASSWKKYVRSPSSPIVKPAGLVAKNTTGKVSNPRGMIDGYGPTVLKRNGPHDDAPTVIVDFGQNVVGQLRINFAGAKGKAGHPGLRLAFSETMESLGDRSDFTRSDNIQDPAQKFTNGTDQISVKKKPYTWTDMAACEHSKKRKVCSDGLHGFRYVKIWLDALEQDAPYTSNWGTVSIDSVELEWSAYLGTPDTFTGWFECSDEDLTQWWYDGVYTTDMNVDLFLFNETEGRNAASEFLNGKQVLFDGAKRDRDPYVGDLSIASLTSYLSHDFPEASFNVLEDLAMHQRDDGWIPPASINNYTLPLFDYPLHWVVCSIDLVMYTGNMTYANTYWTNIVRVLDDYYPQYINKDTGLVVKANELGYGDYAFLPRSGPITYYNALYVHALQYAAQLAETMGKHGKAGRWNKLAASVSKGLMKHNFDKENGAFYDGGPCPDADAGTVCDVHAQDGNSIAVMAGVTDEATSTSVLDYYAKAASHPYGNSFYDKSTLSPNDKFGERVYAFISFFELSARFLTPGAAESAFDEIRRLYGWMATHDPEITQWEGIGPGGGLYEGGFTSMAHGWSTGIVPLMSTYVLGVTPQKPGFEEWRICPVVDGGDLTWAKGVVPTPHGGLKVAWEKDDGGYGSDTSFSLKISAPSGTKGSVCVPTVEGSTVKIDGKTVPKAKMAAGGKGKGYTTVEVGSGSHTITLSS